MQTNDIIAALEEIIEDMDEANWNTARNNVHALYEEITLTPADIKEENDGHWW